VCTTITSVGYGDYSPYSFKNEIFYMFVMVVGMLLRGRSLNAIAKLKSQTKIEML